MTPLLMLFGKAGSGKDTVAGFMDKNHGAVCIAQADPMKRLARTLFEFTDDQLWGPSSSRNAPDLRYEDKGNPNAQQRWDIAEARVMADSWNWLRDVLPGVNGEDLGEAHYKLVKWFDGVKKQTYDQGKPLTPRFVLQTLGTEWGRSFSKNMWVDYAIRTAKELLGGGCGYDRTRGVFHPTEADDPLVKYAPNWVVIADGRFRNEAVAVSMVGGTVIKIEGQDLSQEAGAAGVAGHVSETEQDGIPNHFFPVVFVNDKSAGLAACEQTVEEVLALLPTSRTFPYPDSDYGF